MAVWPFDRLRNGSLSARFRAFAHDDRGASIIFIALTLPAFLGGMGLAAEVGYWQLHHRAMQNAADAAAIAAATSNSTAYATVAQAVTAQYGFVGGAGNVTVSATNPATATGCTTGCYVVTVSDDVPLLLSQVVGYQGSGTAGGKAVSTITASAVASTTQAYSYCILALATTGNAITSDGSPTANLNGCNTMSNSSADCHGHNLNANEGDAVGTNSGCGILSHSNAKPATDTFSGILSSAGISNTCGGTYPQEPAKKGPGLPSSNLWFGNYGYSGVKVVCGDQQLTGNTTLSNTTLVIENGVLDLNGFTMSAQNSTIVFSGTSTGSYQHIPTDNSTLTTGVLDVSAPTSGTWSGVAVYQDPSLTKGVDITYKGNSPAFDISGLAYFPNSNVTVSGVINKSGTGLACFELVVNTILINGTGQIFKNDTQCAQQGLNQTKGGARGMLVN